MAAPAATIASLGASLIKRYSRKFVTKIEWSKGKAAAWVPKIAWTGQPTWGMRVGSSPSGSADFPTAQTQGGDEVAAIVQPSISTYQQDFGVATIEGRLMKAASNKEGTLYDKMVGQIDAIMEGTQQSYSGKIYRGGWGAMSRVHATTSLTTTTLKFEFPEDSVQFEIGMRIQFSSAETGAALRDSGENVRIETINFTAGTCVVSAQLDTVASIAVGDYIFRRGDRHDSASTVKRCITGFEGQFNATDTLHGVVRTGDSRLRGIMIANAGGTEEENIIEGMSEVERYGGHTDAIFMNPTRYRNLIKLATGRYRPASLVSPIPAIGIKGVNLMTTAGESVDVFKDPYCQVNRIWGIEKESLQVFLAGESAQFPQFLDHDGVGQVLRLASADGVECRVGYYADMGCNAPVHNFGITY